MKYFHVHVTVKNLQESIIFYNNLFDAKPTLAKDDYAKWMLAEPRVKTPFSLDRSRLLLSQYKPATT